MISTTHGYTAALVGLLSSLAFFLFTDNNAPIITGDDAFNIVESKVPDAVLPTFAGVLPINSLIDKLIVLVDCNGSEEMRRAESMAKQLWADGSEYRVAFVDYCKQPELSAILQVKHTPYWVTVERSQDFHGNFASRIDAHLTGYFRRSGEQANRTLFTHPIILYPCALLIITLFIYHHFQ